MKSLMLWCLTALLMAPGPVIAQKIEFVDLMRFQNEPETNHLQDTCLVYEWEATLANDPGHSSTGGAPSAWTIEYASFRDACQRRLNLGYKYGIIDIESLPHGSEFKRVEYVREAQAATGPAMKWAWYNPNTADARFVDGNKSYFQSVRAGHPWGHQAVIRASDFVFVSMYFSAADYDAGNADHWWSLNKPRLQIIRLTAGRKKVWVNLSPHPFDMGRDPATGRWYHVPGSPVRQAVELLRSQGVQRISMWSSDGANPEEFNPDWPWAIEYQEILNDYSTVRFPQPHPLPLPAMVNLDTGAILETRDEMFFNPGSPDIQPRIFEAPENRD